MDPEGAARARGRRIEEGLAALLYDRAARPGDALLAGLDEGELEEARGAVRKMVLERTHRGSGGMTSWFPATIAAWRAANPGEGALDRLVERFCASGACRSWRELPAGAPGVSLEEALYRFFCDEGIGEPAVREDEFFGAVVRGLAVTPRARFAWPPSVRPAPGGCFAVTRGLVLHAALDGRYHRGPVTPLIAALLCGETVAAAAARFAVGESEAEGVAEALKGMRLIG